MTCPIHNRLPVRTAAAALSLAVLGSATAQAAPSPQGVWIDSNGRGAVEIKPCGEALCGHVVWVKNIADAKGCGRQIIGDASPAGGTYEGWIYSPEDRKRYNVELSSMKDGRLRVVGYAGMKLFSKTMYWTPAAADLVRCNTGAPASRPAQQAAAAPSVPEPPTLQPSAVEAKVSPGTSQAALAPAPAPASTAPPAHAKDNAEAKAATAAKAEQGSTKPATAAQQPSPAPDETAAADSGTATDTDAGGEIASKPGLKRLARVLDKVIKKSADGDCKLDLPWLKVEFRCEEN